MVHYLVPRHSLSTPASADPCIGFSAFNIIHSCPQLLHYIVLHHMLSLITSAAKNFVRESLVNDVVSH